MSSRDYLKGLQNGPPVRHGPAEKRPIGGTRRTPPPADPPLEPELLSIIRALAESQARADYAAQARGKPAEG